MAEAGDPGIPYIGSLISLISKAEIRYEGTLFSISMEESSIALQNVRSYGTEGRRKDGPQVAPSVDVYEYIIFKGEDIKDLTVLSQVAPPAVAQDPSIISATPQNYGYSAPAPTYGQSLPAPPAANAYGGGAWSQPPPQPQAPGYSALYGNSAWGAPPQTAPPPVQQASAPAPVRPPVQQAAAPAPTVSVAPAGGRPPARQEQAPAPTQQPPPKPSNYAQAAGARPQSQQAGRGGGGRGGGRGPASSQQGAQHASQAGRAPEHKTAAPPIPVPQEDFDFDAMFKKFNKDDVKKEEIGRDTDKEYKKDDFFDLLSCEALDRQDRKPLSEQRRIDMETFGGLGRNYGGHGARGRGRGGYQGGRGGHQGGGGSYQGGGGYQGGGSYQGGGGYQGGGRGGFQGGSRGRDAPQGARGGGRGEGRGRGN